MADAPAFDPTQPFEDLSSSAKPAAPTFDPSQPFEDLSSKPVAPVSPIKDQLSRAVTDIPTEIGSEFHKGLTGMSEATAHDFPALHPIDTIKGVGSLVQAAASPFVGSVKSLLGHGLTAAELATGEHVINPVVQSLGGKPQHPDPEKMYEQSKKDVDTAMSALPAGRAVPKVIPQPTLPAAPFGVTLSEAERTGDLGLRQFEQAGLRGQVGEPAQQHAQEFFNVQRPEQVQESRNIASRQLDPFGNQILAETSAEAAHYAQTGLQQEAARSKAQVKNLYDQAKALPGEISANTFTDMPQNIKSSLSARPDSVIIDDNTPVASRMINYLNDQIGQLKIKNLAQPQSTGLAAPGPAPIVGVNLEGVEQWRKNLSRMRGDALAAYNTNPSDARAASAVIKDFDDRIQQAVNSGAFTGDRRAVDLFNDARAAHSERMKIWGNDAVGKKLQAIIGDAANGRDPADLNDVARWMYSASGTTPNSLNTGVARRIKNVLGENSPEWAAVKQGMFRRIINESEPGVAAGPGTVANRLNKFLNDKGSDLSQVLYSPQERAMLQEYADLHRQMSIPLQGANWSNTGAAAIPHIRESGKRVIAAIGAMIGEHISPVIGSIAGYFGAQRLASALDQRANAQHLAQITRQLPIITEQMNAWRRATLANARKATNSNIRRLSYVTSHLVNSLSRVGIDSTRAMQLLSSNPPEGPGTSEAKERAEGGGVDFIDVDGVSDQLTSGPDRFISHRASGGTPTFDERFSGTSQDDPSEDDMVDNIAARHAADSPPTAQPSVDWKTQEAQSNLAAVQAANPPADNESMWSKAEDAAKRFGQYGSGFVQDALSLPQRIYERPYVRRDVLSDLSNVVTGMDGKDRYQTWPEKVVRSGASLAHDVMSGEVPQWQEDPATGEIHTSPQIIERAQDMAALGGSGGLAGVETGEGAVLGSTPFLRPAVKYEGKIYKGPIGGQHMDALPEPLRDTYARQSVTGEDASNFDLGFLNHKGHFIDREAALDYAIKEGLVPPEVAKQGNLTTDAIFETPKVQQTATGFQAIDSKGNSSRIFPTREQAQNWADNNKLGIKSRNWLDAKDVSLRSDTSEPGAAVSAAERIRTPEMEIVKPAPTDNLPTPYRALSEAQPELSGDVQNFIKLSDYFNQKYGSNWADRLKPEDIQEIKAVPQFIDAANKINQAGLAGAFNKVINTPVSRRSFLRGMSSAAQLLANSSKLGKLFETIEPITANPPTAAATSQISIHDFPNLRNSFPEWSMLTKSQKKDFIKTVQNEIDENSTTPHQISKDEASGYYNSALDDADTELFSQAGITPKLDFGTLWQHSRWPNESTGRKFSFPESIMTRFKDFESEKDKFWNFVNDLKLSEANKSGKALNEITHDEIMQHPQVAEAKKGLAKTVSDEKELTKQLTEAQKPFEAQYKQLVRSYENTPTWWKNLNNLVSARNDALKNVHFKSDTSQPGAAVSALARAEPFYSATEKTIQSAPQSKMHGVQWANWLKNQPGVKPDELEYTGLDSWLRDQKGPVTKDQVADYMNQNKVQLQDVVKSSQKPWDQLTAREQDQIADKFEDWNGITQGDRIHTDDPRVRDWYKYIGGDTKLKYSDYQLPGGENYREHLLMLPEQDPTPRSFEQWVQDTYGQPVSSYPQNIQESLKNSFAQASDIMASEAKNKVNYHSTHWEEPNVLAHVRSNERDVEGVPSLHLEEVQSDWHQAGRRKGYRTERIPDKVVEDRARDAFTYATNGRENWDTLSADRREQWLKNMRTNLESGALKGVGVPNAPFKTSWSELALKRMIQLAAQEGKTRISWTPGEAQAARYDLSKNIDKLQYNPDTKKLVAHKGDNLVMDKEVQADKLADFVGKEVADKLINNPTKKLESPNNKGTFNYYLTGQDLKIGGEGMKGFYDKMLPKMVEKLGKQYGVKVKRGRTGTDNSGYKLIERNGRFFAKSTSGPREVGPFSSKDQASSWMNNLSDLRKSEPVHYFDIPEKMKQDVLTKGFPLFSDTSHAAAINAYNHSNDISRPIQHEKSEHEINVPERASGGRVVASNINPSPSEAQKDAGNYKKDHVSIQGLDMTIENAKGHTRSGIGRDGRKWSVKLPEHYGYINRTEGSDGDHVDVYLGPHTLSKNVFVVNQIDADTKKFDEHKIFIGFRNLQHVLNTYERAFSDGRALERVGSIVSTTMDAFKHWLKTGNTKTPFSLN